MFAFMKKMKSAAARGQHAARARGEDAGAGEAFVNGNRIVPPFPAGLERATFGMGCFWGAERLFWNVPASTAPPSATRAARRRTRPTRKSAAASPTTPRRCWSSFDPKKVAYETLLKVFWEGHDPTQGMRQGNDRARSTAQRSTRMANPQMKAALSSKEVFQTGLKKKRFGRITTEIEPAPEFYYAEDYHQQYLGKNPNGYCGLGGTGVSCPIGVLAKA